MRDSMTVKDFEINDLKKLIKSTKIKELEVELKVYMQECVRLRQITERSIKLSGELDVNRMR